MNTDTAKVCEWRCASCGLTIFGGDPEFCDLCDPERRTPLCCDCFQADHDGSSHGGDLDLEVEL